MVFIDLHCFSLLFIDFNRFSLILLVLDPGCPASCGILWRAVAACGAAGLALLEDCILEAWGPGGLQPGDLEARMMRLMMRMLMDDGKDEDKKVVSHAQAWEAWWILSIGLRPTPPPRVQTRSQKLETGSYQVAQRLVPFVSAAASLGARNLKLEARG